MNRGITLSKSRDSTMDCANKLFQQSIPLFGLCLGRAIGSEQRKTSCQALCHFCAKTTVMVGYQLLGSLMKFCYIRYMSAEAGYDRRSQV